MGDDHAVSHRLGTPTRSLDASRSVYSAEACPTVPRPGLSDLLLTIMVGERKRKAATEALCGAAPVHVARLAE
jgi:hypothetical protein